MYSLRLVWLRFSTRLLRQLETIAKASCTGTVCTNQQKDHEIVHTTARVTYPLPWWWHKTRVFRCIERQAVILRVSCACIQETEKHGGDNFTHAPTPYPFFLFPGGRWFLHAGSRAGLNKSYKFQLNRFKGLGSSSPRWPKIAILHWLEVRIALTTCYTVMALLWFTTALFRFARWKLNQLISRLSILPEKILESYVVRIHIGKVATFSLRESIIKLRKNKRFLSLVSTLTRAIDIAILSVRPSVRPSVRLSVRPWHAGIVGYENGLKYRHSFFTIR